MGHLSYEESKKVVVKGLILLGVLTIVEVAIALFANGHITSFDVGDTWMRYVYMLLMIGLSLYKAYFIVYEFMHMRYEAKGLAASVLMPTMLLVWAIVAFFNEGASYGERRNVIDERDKVEVENPTYKIKKTSMLERTKELKKEDFK